MSHEPKEDAEIGRLIRASGRGPVPPPGARDRVYAAVRAEWERTVAAAGPERSAARSWPGAFGLFAAAAATIVIAIGVVSFLREPAVVDATSIGAIEKVLGPVRIAASGDGPVRTVSAAGSGLVVGDRLIVGAQGGAAVNLAEGESLRLDGGTEVRFGAVDRIELLSGVVYVDSGEGPASGLTVATRFGDVRHVGTQYEIGLEPADLRVRVREGRVAITAQNTEVVGRAGEEIRVPDNGEVSRAAIAPTDAAWQWTERLALLPEEADYRLPDVLAWIARQTGRQLRFGSAASESDAGTLVLHGLGGLTPAETLDALRSTTDLEYRLTDGELAVD